MEEVAALMRLDIFSAYPHRKFWFCFCNAIYIQYSPLSTSRNPKINELFIIGLVLTNW